MAPLAQLLLTFILTQGQISAERIPFSQQKLTIEELSPGHVGDSELFEADMLLTDEQWEQVRSRKAIPFDSSRWKEVSNGYPLVPYLFQDSVDKAAVRAGINHWQQHTCIRFQETTNTNQNHIKFFKGSGCWSHVGMTDPRGQQISLADGCTGLGTVAHEIGHAMGFFHEQSRSDRDNHVVIKSENIESGKEGNFRKATDNNFGVQYDYSSDMHYGSRSFTKNGKLTIVTKDPLAQELIGSRDGLSHRDKLLANKMYKCIDKWLAKCSLSKDPCQNEGYTGANCKCVCPPGTSGDKCQNRVKEYYADLRSANTEKVTTEKTLTSAKGSGSYTKWIVAPECKLVKLTFSNFELYTKNNDICYFEYLNIRAWADITNGLTYCDKMITAGRSFTSKTGEMVLYHENRGPNTPGWTAKVTFVPKAGCSPTGKTTTTTTTTTTTATTVAPTKANACAKKPKTQVLKDGETATFVNPGSPAPAKGANKCGWKFKVGPNADLEISCSQFKLQGPTKNKCKKDYIKIGKDKFCGGTGPSKNKAKAKTTTITFKSNKKAKADTFTCTATAVPKKLTTTPPPPTTTPSSKGCSTEGSECSATVGSQRFTVIKTKRSWEGCQSACSSKGLSMAEPADTEALADYLRKNTGGWRYWLGAKGQCTGTPVQCKADTRPFKWLSGSTIPWTAPWYGNPQSMPKSHAVMLRAMLDGSKPLMAIAPHALGYCLCQ